MATGCLSSKKVPDFKRLETFEGDWYHTASWPKEGVDFTGKRVAVVGTGSTGIQAIPSIARQAHHLTVFQRTPNFSVPANNAPLDPAFEQEVKQNYRELRRKVRENPFGIRFETNEQSALDVAPEQRQREYESRWQNGGFTFVGAYGDLLYNQQANDTAAEFVRSKIRATVHDPAVAELLCPKDYPIGTKRICVDIEYYETFNRENVTLVDIRSAPIKEVTAKGIRTADAEYELDVIVFAIGFDAMTGALFDIDIRGKSGLPLRQAWADGPRTYLGLAIAGFPNLFIVTGPGSPSVLSNMVVSIEQHVDWIADCLKYLREHEINRIECTREAQDAWVEHVAEIANATLYPRANSWYLGANVPGKPRVFMPYFGGVGPYRQKCDEVAAKQYEGFALDRSKARLNELSG